MFAMFRRNVRNEVYAGIEDWLVAETNGQIWALEGINKRIVPMRVEVGV